ncbi:hypothetical protein ABB37_07438 [Leptomonas pyrrhocoris]|uniref:Uncharacterized protein n=1 Tax=Leptomonas pyrrhocoris TaxID=157538 RepID=A0A0N0VE22_LEPPY|nr:hypothetical protein ABB37_07438 [Leptomonas pyrrhocoris]KPA77128.1 hypothetical protein ABB37_07438 [Leptomonas pyrrhocoris]|eukprot:XP_015655567.1 hypothetical protein ABB37_07438 [Leptomonas pyrrhocoris]
MAELACMVYSGLGGLLMIVLLGLATTVFFISSYYYRRLGAREEKRPPVVFFFDLLKMLVAGSVASLVNYTFTAKVSWAASGITVRGKPLEGIGWYGAISVVDVLVGAPLSIAVGRLINRTCKIVDRHLRTPSPWKDTVHQNTVYGKYSDEHDCSCDYRHTAPPVRWSWWYSQAVTWTCACVLGEMMSGLTVLYSFLLVRSLWNPVAWIAVLISFWNLNCLLKQYIVVTCSRFFLSYARLAVIDYFNQYKEPKHPAVHC